ncbi:MAG: hypothetical protein P4M08_03960 [Oligoflexia bacterium]|nr:hypothetical protein [Oligoflexia bacterium]
MTRAKVAGILTSTLFLLPLAALGDGGASGVCKQQVAAEGLLDLEVIKISDGSCFMSLTPNDPSTIVYRSYSFDEDGLFMVFDSTDGPEATSNGARNYFFFPRKNVPTYQVLADGTIAVTNSAGEVFNLSEKTGYLVSIPSMTYTLDPGINMKNNGGLNITSAPGVWLDTGWYVGAAAYQHPDLHSTFHSGTATCDVKNSEIFTNDSDMNPHFNFPQDSDLAKFLMVRCPNLNLSSLNSQR